MDQNEKRPVVLKNFSNVLDITSKIKVRFTRQEEDPSNPGKMVDVTYEIHGRRLTEAQTDALRSYRVGVIPPMVEGPNQTRTPNFYDPNYIARKDEAEKKARAMTIVMAFPELLPGLTPETPIEQVVDGVTKVLPSSLFHTLLEAAQAPVGQLVEIVDFF